MTQPLIRRTLTEFFRDLLQGALRSQEVEPSENAEYYLVALLERFAHPEQKWDARPLALEYLESFHSPTPFRFAKLKHVGDTALFLSGIFMERLERQLVSTDYYTSLGRVAYGHLAALPWLPVVIAAYHVAYGLGTWRGLWDVLRGQAPSSQFARITR